MNQEKIKNEMIELVNKFIKSYQSQNPKNEDVENFNDYMYESLDKAITDKLLIVKGLEPKTNRSEFLIVYELYALAMIFNNQAIESIKIKECDGNAFISAFLKDLGS